MNELKEINGKPIKHFYLEKDGVTYTEKTPEMKLKDGLITAEEYNNIQNTLESVSGLVSGVTNLITSSLQSLDLSVPLVEPEAFVTYIHGKIKDIDPDAADLINEETIKQYIGFTQAKYRAQLEQLGINNEE